LGGGGADGQEEYQEGESHPSQQCLEVFPWTFHTSVSFLNFLAYLSKRDLSLKTATP
jgi:hypothetical protein